MDYKVGGTYTKRIMRDALGNFTRDTRTDVTKLLECSMNGFKDHLKMKWRHLYINKGFKKIKEARHFQIKQIQIGVMDKIWALLMPELWKKALFGEEKSK